MKRVLTVFLLMAFAVWAQHGDGGHGGAPAHPATHQEQAGHHGPDLTPWKIANFVLLLIGLGYLIRKKGGPFLAGRSREIRKGIEEAARMKAEAEARAAEIDRKMAALGAEIEELRRAAREEMAAEQERLREETRQQIAKIQSHAEQEIASAGKAARQQLKEHAAELAIKLAEQKIRVRMTAEAQDRLLAAFTEGLGRQAPREPAGGVN